MTVIINNEKIPNVKWIKQEKGYINIIYGEKYWSLSRLVDNKNLDLKIVG